MQTPVPDYLSDVLDACREPDEGDLADYIPQLAQVNRDDFAVAISTPDGTVYRAGDCGAPFTIQSISKPFAYALALQQHGIDGVLEHVGAEPSGDAFNEISLDPATGRPRNPMINIGAITTHGLIGEPEMDGDERFAIVREGLSAFAGRELEVDEDVYASELDTADRNRALAFMARTYDRILGDPIEVVRGYTKQCSLVVSTSDLAIMAATLADGGVNPLSGRRVLSPEVVRQVLSVMTTCGMYDAAGDWVSSVGIPAKSGVSGGILGVLPGQVGIGVFSPPLDSFGNSVRGVRVCERLSADMGLHLMSAAPAGPSTVREVRHRRIELDGVPRNTTIVELQGVIHFSEGERVLRRLVALGHPDEPGADGVALCLTRVTSFNQAGRRMLLEGIRRLSLDGYDVTLVDPDRTLPDPDAGDGVRPRVVTELPD
ncbi:glutaminase [Ornithinimicrobium sp. Y1847]|uniref:glutaminase n=1 Tax=unclassified Ornithinimicrobium TaxID=2615080 RepID=UPI003B685BB4